MSYRKYKTTPISDDQSYRTPPFFKDTQFPVLLQCSYNLGLNVGRKYATLSECLYYVVKNLPFLQNCKFQKAFQGVRFAFGVDDKKFIISLLYLIL